MSARRCACWLAGVWAGVLAGVAVLAAPDAFATLAPSDAGRFVSRLFAQEAALSVAVAVLLLLIDRLRARRDGLGTRPALNADVGMVLGTIFCTVAGYYALQPLMELSKAGQGRWSFGALHAASGSFFVVKGVLVAILAWRLAPR